MIGAIGNALFLCSCVLMVVTIVVKDYRIKKDLYITYSGLIFLAFILLISAFIMSDFSLKNVFFNSSLNKPLIYKISGAWASHEGSFLMWLSFLSMMGILLCFTIDNSIRVAHINISSVIILLFLLFLSLTSNPFETFDFLPKDGLGLNPTLQDIALSIHPPILYIGYVACFPVFLCGVFLLLYPNLSYHILLRAQYFLRVAMCALSAGVALGSWWAYRELGWGGYWFFDPVENISLLPWLVGVALYHFLMVSIKRQQYINWTIFLCITLFLTVLYGLFFVRSGIISSVHSFAFSAERGLFIFAISMLITIVSLVLFIFKRSYITSKEFRVTDIFIGNILWITAAIILLIGIIYPIFYSYFRNADVAIDPGYYHKIFLPIFLPILMLAGFVQKIAKKELLERNSCIAFITFLFSGGMFLFVKNLSFGICLFIFGSIYLMVASAVIFLHKTYKMKMTQVDVVVSGDRSIKLFSFFLGHFGFGLLVFAICLNNIFSSEIQFSGNVNTSASNGDMVAYLQNVTLDDNDVFYKQIAHFAISDMHGNIVNLLPENRLYKIENVLSQEADIYSFITHDLYIVLGRVKDDIINAEIYYRPFMSMIWLAAFMISCSFLVLIKKN